MTKVLPQSFYTRDNVVQIAQDLLGKVIVTTIDGAYTSGIITETEAYSGRNDKACHAHQGRVTKRTQIMYATGGCAYVYLCYGIHHLFNIVTNEEGFADAILIRAIQPLDGVKHMKQRRNKDKVDAKFAGGPGTLSQALGITKELYGASLLEQSDSIWIENHGISVQEIKASPRIGIDYAEEDALLPWRFVAVL
jgi:DNA-3-methyladenine glycosylase